MKLALLGGKPVLQGKLPDTHIIGHREINAVVKVMKKGPLSGFVANWDERFFGGEEVNKLEANVAKVLGVKETVSFNSATTALQAAIGALSIGPGDEVIVPPYTMSATATCVIANGAVPIFADIDDKTFCLDAKAVKKNITKNTKAIIAVNLFGGSANFSKLLKIAKQHKLKIIEDNSQAFGATYKGKLCGTIGDIGVFSLNVHKIIQSGEGGLLVTNNKNYAARARLYRNHGEVIVDQMKNYKLGPIMGSNFRMTEVTAVIAGEQIKKLPFLVKHRINLANYLTKKLSGYAGLETCHAEDGNKHVYYLYPIKFNGNIVGISRDTFVDAMTAEGFPMSKGYVKPLYLIKMFQEQKVFNNTSFPFKNNYYSGSPTYNAGLCPVCERLWKKELTYTEICQYPRTSKHIDLFVKAVEKILQNISELADYENNI